MIQVNKSGEEYIQTRLDELGLDWRISAVIEEIEESAENMGDDHVRNYGYEYETRTRDFRGYIQTINLSPKHFNFIEIELD